MRKILVMIFLASAICGYSQGISDSAIDKFIDGLNSKNIEVTNEYVERLVVVGSLNTFLDF